MMTNKTTKQAYHEAGHAVIARVQGIPVDYVVLFPDSDALALTQSAAYLARDADQATRLAAIMKDIIVCLAGPYAQHRHRPLKKPGIETTAEWEGDFDNVRGLAVTAALIASGADISQFDPAIPVTLTTEEQQAYVVDMLRRAQDTTRDLVAEHWLAIERVAKALLDRPILDGVELDELIGGITARRALVEQK
jgi:ATP-dependent Zn protease